MDSPRWAARRRAALITAAVVVVAGGLAAFILTHESRTSPPLKDPPLRALGSVTHLPGLPPYPVPADEARQSFGINAQFLFTQFPASIWGIHAHLMKQAGIQIVRVDAPWGQVELTPPDASGHHHYQWGYTDSIAGYLAAAGVRWLPVIDFSAPWDSSYAAAGTDPKLSPPRHTAYFAAYARAFVHRYGRHGTYWHLHPALPKLPVRAVEVWNEENLNIFWNPAPSAPTYLALYEATRRAVHAVEPTVEVMVGGLADPVAQFLSALYTAGGNRRGLFDGVAIHPYDSSAQAVVSDVAGARAVLDQHGDIDVPLDVTEVGWPTRGATTGGLPVLSDVQRGAALSALTATLARSDCGVERILPHTWITLEHNGSNPGDWFGLVHPDGMLSLSALAYARTIMAFERHPQGAATLAVCRRALSVTAALARGQRQPKRGEPGRRRCAVAVVKSLGFPVDGASVYFQFLAARGQPHLTRRTAVTDAGGHAVSCVSSSRGTTGQLKIVAERPDFARTALATISLRLS